MSQVEEAQEHFVAYANNGQVQALAWGAVARALLEFLNGLYIQMVQEMYAGQFPDQAKVLGLIQEEDNGTQEAD